MNKNIKNIALLILILSIILLFPILLNWLLLQKSIGKVVGDETTWLAFWPVYLSAVASFGMIFFTYKSLQQNKKQLEQIKIQKEEEERARIVFSVIVYNYAFLLKISNIGKRNVFNAEIKFNEDFLDMLGEERFREAFRQFSSPFFLEAGMSKYLFLGFCEDINKEWENKNVIIKMKGRYNNIYPIDEELDMSLFMDKPSIIVQGDLETTMDNIKKGLIVQNNSYMPVQKSLDQIAKILNRLESSITEVVDSLKENLSKDDDSDDFDEDEVPQNNMLDHNEKIETSENDPQKDIAQPSVLKARENYC